MSTRVAQRTAATVQIDLPADPIPQYVNEEGYEVDAETFALAMGYSHAAVNDENLGGEEEEDIAAEHPGEDVEANGEEAVETTQDEEAVPLLSLSESLVLPYSLNTTRQHHMQNLFPRIFSHPPVPSHNRPRARGPPRGTFVYPTPPPPVAPLPTREYHGPSLPKASSSLQVSPSPSTPSTPADEAGPSTPSSATGQKKVKGSKGKGKDAGHEKENEPPAHEIECIARVTVSIGPISYPGTELWVGRFVEPRASVPKPSRKRDAGEKRPGERKQSKLEHAPAKRPRMEYLNPPGWTPLFPGQRFQSTTASHNGHAGPSNRTVPGRPPPHLQPGQGQPRPLPPPRSDIPPSLIQRVNQAATRHAWLSTIIHKAARNLASKDELAKLGRVVNRLKAGLDVGEGPDDPPTGPTSGVIRTPVPPMTGATASTSANTVMRPVTPSSAVPTSSSTGATSAPASSTSTTQPAQPVTTTGEDSDSDSEVDMKGPKQVGGGSLNATDPIAESDGLTSPSPSTPLSEAPSPLPPAPLPQPSGSTSAPNRPMPLPPIPKPSIAPSLLRPPTMAIPQRPPAPPPPPPPPRRRYPLPPPFLLIAFKDAPTEKLMIPLGMNSYISRVGQPTNAAPSSTMSQPPDSAPSANPVPGTASNTPVTIAETAAMPDSAVQTAGIKSRTRASLGRQSIVPETKVATPPPEPPVAAQPPTEVTLPTEPHRPVLPSLPGMKPSNGTVLISTFLPAEKWQSPDWDNFSRGLPFENKYFDIDLNAPQVKTEPAALATEESAATSSALSSGTISTADKPISPASPVSPGKTAPQSASPATARPSRQAQITVPPKAIKDEKPTLLNLACEDFLPAEGPVYPITIRMSDLSDAAWGRMRSIIAYVEETEMRALSRAEPDIAGIEPPTLTPTPTPTSNLNVPGQPPRPPSLPTPTLPPISAKLRQVYLDRKRSRFHNLLARVPPRSFLRYRLASPSSELIEATTDKWAPRPYPISTKPLYNPDDESGTILPPVVVPLSPELPAKKGKKGDEPTVTFEMPVSLDQLDERVAESAMFLAGTKKGRKKRGGAVGGGVDGRKKQSRAIPGKICEGCAGVGLKVWRRGPGGKGTLCNACGALFLSGTLGELKAPGAAATAEPEPEGSEDLTVAKEEVQAGQEETSADASQVDQGGGDAPVSQEGEAAPKHAEVRSPQETFEASSPVAGEEAQEIRPLTEAPNEDGPAPSVLPIPPATPTVIPDAGSVISVPIVTIDPAPSNPALTMAATPADAGVPAVAQLSVDGDGDVRMSPKEEATVTE